MNQSATAKKKSGDIELHEDDLLLSSKKALEAAKNLKIKSKKNIGKAAIEAESNVKPKRKNKRPIIDAKTISRADLMQMAANIEVNGSNLSNVYDTHLISEKGLRKLVDLYLRGEDIRRDLRQEIINETSHLVETSGVESEVNGSFSRRRLVDAIVVSLITAILLALIAYMVRRF